VIWTTPPSLPNKSSTSKTQKPGPICIEGNARIHAPVLKVVDEGEMPDIEILYWKKGRKKDAAEFSVGR
jgi:hypothetical protein